jgi:hypothetical protein
MIPNVKPSIIYPLKDKVAPQSIAAAGTAQTALARLLDGQLAEAHQLLVGAGAGTAAVSLDQATTAAGAGAKALATAAQVGITAQGTGTVEADLRPPQQPGHQRRVRVHPGRPSRSLAARARWRPSRRTSGRSGTWPDSREGEARLATPRLSFFSRRNLWRLAT